MREDNQYMLLNGIAIVAYIIYLFILNNLSNFWEEIWTRNDNPISASLDVMSQDGKTFTFILIFSILVIGLTVFFVYKNITDFYGVSPLLKLLITIVYIVLTIIHFIILSNPVLRIVFGIGIIGGIAFLVINDNY